MVVVYQATAPLFVSNHQMSIGDIDRGNKDELFIYDQSSNEIAFIVFTSASTDIPEGVSIGGENLSLSLQSMCQKRNILSSDILL